MNSLRFIFFISICLTFSHRSFAQEKQRANKPAPGQAARLTIRERKMPDGRYQYRFVIHNKSTVLVSPMEPFRNDSEAAKRGKNIIWNWGLITGDKELALSLTCLSLNDFDHQLYHFYDEKGNLKCSKWIPQEGTAAKTEFERTDQIMDIKAPDFAKRFILKKEGFNPSDGMTIGFVWYWSGENWIAPGKSLEGFGFTLKGRLDKKKIRFWTFYKTEFSSSNIEFISE